MQNLADRTQIHPLELQASDAKLFYVKKSGGKIGMYGYGAGVAMATMDALAVAGGKVIRLSTLIGTVVDVFYSPPIFWTVVAVLPLPMSEPRCLWYCPIPMSK